MIVTGLRMQGIQKHFGATIALDGVDLDVRAGEVHALIGENGAGKSTLMKVLSGAIQPGAGSMQLDGATYAPRNPAAGRRAGVAVVYQELSLAPHLSVQENMLLGAEPTVGPFVNRGEARRRAADALRQVGHGDLPLDWQVRRLLVAQQQLVEIARAVASGCRVLVLDEPTSSLPAGDVQRLFELVQRLRSNGTSVIYISHVLEEVREISDRFTVLRDGKTVGGGVTADASIRDIVALMIGRDVRELYPRSARTPGEAVLEIQNLAGATKPAEATLTLHRGEVVGIAGLIGAGRTELLRAIFGLDRVRRGDLRVGLVTGPRSPATRWQYGAGLVSEDRKQEGLALNLSLADNLTLPRLRGLGPFGLVTPGGQTRATLPWISQLAVKCASPAQRINDLSGGNQQKIALARLLHADVDVLLLDEPTRGIDVGSKAQIYKLIDELTANWEEMGPQSGALPSPEKAQSGALWSPKKPRAVLMVSSYLPELLGVCDRIAVMCRGKLGPARPVSELDEHRIMLEATGVNAESTAA